VKTRYRLVLSLVVVLAVTSSAPAWYRCRTAAPMGGMVMMPMMGVGAPVVGGGMQFNMSMSGDPSLAFPLLSRFASLLTGANSGMTASDFRNILIDVLGSKVPLSTMTKSDLAAILKDFADELKKPASPPAPAPAPAGGADRPNNNRAGAVRPVSPEYIRARAAMIAMLNESQAPAGVVQSPVAEHNAAARPQLASETTRSQIEVRAMTREQLRASLRQFIAEGTSPVRVEAPATASDRLASQAR